MAPGRALALLAAGAFALTACGVEMSVTAERSDRIVLDPTGVDPGSPATTPDPPGTPTSPGTPASPGTPTPTSPGTTAPDDPATPPPASVPSDPTAIDFGPDKPPRGYDDFLLAVITDLQLWWEVEYPAIYGTSFRRLEGKVYAAYPGRPDDLPGCGSPSTTYEEVRQYVAFYCGVGDFMVYDDSADGLLAELEREYGFGTIGTVLAHEFGHAIQLRAGNLDRALPTILTEQQSDCFAGAWSSRVARGESPVLRYTDADVRAGLIAMTKVSDPVGTDQFVEGGHGSGFDRVGAFQVGFAEGPARCAEILDEPLPLVPNQFTSADAATGGDARFGYGDGELLAFLPEDLNLYWDQQLARQIPTLDALSLVVVRSLDDVRCSDLRGDFTRGAALCASTREVYFNEPAALDLYRSLGDFSVGYLLGIAWGESVQIALGSELTGEDRALLNDCLTGGWVQTVIPVPDGRGFLTLPEPRLEARTSSVSAGDLDEAIQTVLLVADLDDDADEVGSAFEKIEALRTGVLDGTDACLAQL
ncbi:MAG: hypothetical protein WCA57_11685 [Ilumatobacteraceae bacterium]